MTSAEAFTSNPSSSSSVTVREARHSDLERVHDIYTLAIEMGISTMDVGSSRSSLAAELRHLSERESLLVAIVDGRVEGFAWLRRYSPRFGYRFACETSLYVDPEMEGRGLGRLLQKALLNRAQDYGYRHVTAKILAVNPRSLQFHRSFGFEEVGRQRGIGEVRGVHHDVVILQLILKPSDSHGVGLNK